MSRQQKKVDKLKYYNDKLTVTKMSSKATRGGNLWLKKNLLRKQKLPNLPKNRLPNLKNPDAKNAVNKAILVILTP